MINNETDYLNIFLVRHGKSKAHDENKRQSPDSPLGETGLKQVGALAERMGKEKIDLIISSKWERAHQTAKAVADKMGIELELFEGIHEKELNPSLYGCTLEGEEYENLIKELKEHLGDLDWKYGNEGESTRDLIKRAQFFIQYLLRNYRNKNILVVSHGLFIRSFILLALLGEKYSDDAFAKLYNGITFSNTGISLIRYSFKENSWELQYLNDHMHIR